MSLHSPPFTNVKLRTHLNEPALHQTRILENEQHLPPANHLEGVPAIQGVPAATGDDLLLDYYDYYYD